MSLAHGLYCPIYMYNKWIQEPSVQEQQIGLLNFMYI